MAKSGLVGKVLGVGTTMCNDYSKRIKGYKKFRKNWEHPGTTKRVVNDERGCVNWCSEKYDMACWTTIHSTGRWNTYALMSMSRIHSQCI